MTLIEQFQVVLIFLIIGVGMIVAPMILLTILRPHKPKEAKGIVYECGMDPIGDAQVCFDMRFYTDALIFLIFEVETVFLFPWARVFRQPEWTGIALFEGLVFVGILFLGLIYVWAKGDIDWVKSVASSRDMVREHGVPPYRAALEGAGTPRPKPEPVGASSGGQA